MAHLLSFIDTRHPNPPEPPPNATLPPTESINTSRKTALVVEDHESLLIFLRRSLNNEGYAVRTAGNSEEGLRLYRDCGPFNVVLIKYSVPQHHGDEIDHCAPLQKHGIALAMAIHTMNPSQGMIITAIDYQYAGQVTRPQELMHIPLLIDISNFRLRSLLGKIEVDRAIAALTQSDLQRLRQFANFRVRGLGRAAGGRTWEDLLAEAVLRTLVGAEATQKGRHWNKDVDFVRHLTGAMQSISNSWKRSFKESEPYLVSEIFIRDAEGQELSPLDTVASGHAPTDQRLIEKDEEDRVFCIFKDDPEATQVLQGLVDGLKKTEILLRFGLDAKQYAAAVKRIRIKLAGHRNGED